MLAKNSAHIDEPVDLSRRDSVESRKSSSPSSSSSFRSLSGMENVSSKSSDYNAAAYQLSTLPLISAFLESNKLSLQAICDQKYSVNPTSSFASSNLPTMPAADSFEDALLSSDQRYMLYRNKMLQQRYASSNGNAIAPNPKMRRNANPSNALGNLEMYHPDGSTSDEQVTAAAAADTRSLSGSESGYNNGLTKDGAYYERRQKNNVAAKKSRDRRRLKEEELIIRASYLERENIKLKAELATAKRQLAAFMVK